MNNIYTESSIKILEVNPQIHTLTALRDAIFHAQTKSFQKSHDYSVFDIPLVFSPTIEFLLNKHFDFQKTEKQFDISLKQHKYIKAKYNDLNEFYNLNEQVITEFKLKTDSDQVQNILKKYLHSGGCDRRKMIIDKVNLSNESIILLDKTFFRNPFLTIAEINQGLTLLEEIESKANLGSEIQFVLRKNVLNKNSKYIEKLILDTGLSINDIYSLNTFFNPRTYLLKDENKWRSVANQQADFDLMYKAIAVISIFYKVKINENVHNILVEKLNSNLLELENTITSSDENLSAKINNLQTLTNLFSDFYTLLPSLDLKTRSLVREISVDTEKNKGLLTWDHVLNTPFYKDILIT